MGKGLNLRNLRDNRTDLNGYKKNCPLSGKQFV